MKIAFILPAIGKKKGKRYIRSWQMEPLMIAVLKRLTPAEVPCVFFDDRLEAIDFHTNADVIAISVETHTAKRSYDIARRFKERGKIIIMGGYHPTIMPEDARPHADILMIGNAESVWGQMLEDIKNGCHLPEYRGESRMDYGLPDRSIYADKQKKYLPIALIEIGRGCRHNCEFCSIYSYYRRCYVHRRIEDIVEEIKQCKSRVYFLVDDSIFSDKVFAKELFTEVAKLKITWVTQVTLDVARDEELLHLMKKSGCEVILIGFESIDPDNLKQMNKDWTAKIGERDELVERIHKAGISIYASFVFGFDYDNEQSFQNCLDFSMKHQFFVAAYNHLLAFPGTETYERIHREGRLIYPKWWMEDEYCYGMIPYRPKLLDAAQIGQLCKRYKKEFFKLSSIFIRSKALKKRTNRRFISFTFWVANLMLFMEVDKRFGIQLGGYLDEKKK